MLARMDADLGSGSIASIVESLIVDRSVIGTADISTAAAFVAEFPSRQVLRDMYGSADVDPALIWLDILRTQRDHVVVFDMFNFVVVTRSDFLNGNRWVFNKFTIANRNSMGEAAHPIYIDARVMDCPPTKEMLEEIDLIQRGFGHRKRLQKAMSDKVRIRLPHVMSIYKHSQRNPVLIPSLTVEFKKVTTLTGRPWKAVEFVIRDYAEAQALMMSMRDK